MTPFELLVVVRVQVKDRTLLQRCLALQAAMEALAPVAGLDVTACSLAGLGSGIDAQLCRDNPDRRGQVAAQMLVAEGVPHDIADAVRDSSCEPRVDALSPLAAALVAAAALADVAYELVELGQPIDEIAPALLAQRLTRRAERRGDAAAQRALDALARLDADLERAAERALAGMVCARSDIGLD